MFEMSAFTVFLLTFLLICVLIRLIGKWKSRKTPPGPYGLPIVGHLPLLGKSPIKTFANWRKQYGDVFRIRMGSWNTVVVNGYEAINEAAEKHDDSFSSRPNFTTQRILKECHGEVSLAFGPFDDSYLIHRKITATILRTFTGRMSSYTEELLCEEADILTSKVLEKAKDGPVDIRDDIQYSVGSVIYQMLYGRSEDVEEDLERMIQTADEFDKFSENGNPFDVMPWLERFMPKALATFRRIITDGVTARAGKIQEHIDNFCKDGQERDIIDGFLAADIGNIDNQTQITRSRLLGTVADLQGAGFDTTNKSLQYLVLHMCKYPDIQTKVQREIDDIIGGRNKVTLSDRKHLVFTEATVLESMRIATIVPFALPRCSTKETQLQGHTIEKDTVVFFNLHSASYDKELWEDPENFRPERFIDEHNALDMKKCCRVVPFSLGRRRCVGEHFAKMEIFIMFANMMQKCSFLKPDGETLDTEPVPGLVYSPKPYRVIVKERM